MQHRRRVWSSETWWARRPIGRSRREGNPNPGSGAAAAWGPETEEETARDSQARGTCSRAPKGVTAQAVRTPHSAAAGTRQPTAPGRASSGSRHFHPTWARATSQRTHGPRALGHSTHTRCFQMPSCSQGTQHSTGRGSPPAPSHTRPRRPRRSRCLVPQGRAGRHTDVRSQDEWRLTARVPGACGAEPPGPLEGHSRWAP